ncbi:hypothetical protein CBG46_05315 [Actinobacillus succinogenes]|uniref:Putative lipoprotein n=1 Tax=Actinobacillus succinogenes (strain ATCC 55618 / DSM 22257 / CCUG 43843 / 130Z) TaxID=339671 RepID=A6VKB1_ACTSZ|nr:YecR-like lipofamily protein [Actinobacillus succinogenes]ABR73408.1 putative lipoprotein [Actinobacillus succinogenes 130Z]PHI40125.1 hypothetical protein CBG46_05315 [Actinobacillus succinogenes]
MKKLLMLICMVCSLTACVSEQKRYVATGGSRADGVINLSYQVRYNERAAPNPNQGLRLAQKRCRQWGYQNAERFSGYTRRCNIAKGRKCLSYLITVQYQCF